MSETAPAHRSPQEGKKSLESPELFRGSLGLDFLFTKDKKGNKRCVCIEINGDYAGIAGVDAIPRGGISGEQRLLAQIRDTRSPERGRKVDKAAPIIQDIKTNVFPASPEAKKKIREYLIRSIEKAPLMTHAFSNPKFIHDITMDKNLQRDFIPEQYAARIYVKGESPLSSSVFWLCKPWVGWAGMNILVLSNAEFANILLGSKNEEFYSAQEFVEPLGADEAPEHLRRNAASMRLLVDFRYLADGTVDHVFESSYQRVSPLEAKPVDVRESHAGRQRRYVVNKSSGASSVPASREELRMAREATNKIIAKLAEGYMQSLKTAE